MEQLEERAGLAIPGAALALAVGAAASFGIGDVVGFLSDAAEDLFIATWLLGWVLLAWSAMLGGGSAVLLVQRGLSRRPVSLRETALVAASLVLVVLVVASHPLWGSGSGFGG
ncbi:hypothetical protein [Mycetocola sp. 2940]|uniref:hypothetical protein n=1 Tax=Mycetocola sp. 2940 TaxID=3156452 RepID=UPI0033941C1A